MKAYIKTSIPKKRAKQKKVKSIYHWIPFWSWNQKPLRSVNSLFINEQLVWHFWYVDDEKIASTLPLCANMCTLVFFAVFWLTAKIIIYGCCSDCQSQVPNKVHVCVFFASVYVFLLIEAKTKKNNTNILYACICIRLTRTSFQVYLLIGFHLRIIA